MNRKTVNIKNKIISRKFFIRSSFKYSKLDSFIKYYIRENLLKILKFGSWIITSLEKGLKNEKNNIEEISSFNF